MNKKIFAALASATMALSATGSLAVFAEDFDAVPEAVGDNGVGSGVVIPNAGVEVNVENFPDNAFRGMIMNGNVVKDEHGNPVTFNYGQKITKAELDSVASITFGADVVETTGVEYFQNLTSAKTAAWATTATGAPADTAGNEVTADNTAFATVSNALKNADLSKNMKLETIDFQNVPNLSTLEVPATKNLQNVTVIGGVVQYAKQAAGQTDPFMAGLPAGIYPYNSAAFPEPYLMSYDSESLAPKAYAPIHVLDLSKNKGLETVTVIGTNVANLDLSNNIYLTGVNVSGNKINTLNLDNNDALTQLYCFSNQLYGLELPETDQLTKLVAGYNILQEIDLTGSRGIVDLYLQHNELRALDLSANANLKNMDIRFNHIGALDLSSNKLLLPNDAATKYSPQIVYVDSAYDGINLTDSFDDFDRADLTGVIDPKDTYEKKTGILTVDGNSAQYTYNVGNNKNADNKALYPLNVIVLKEAVLNRLYNPNSGEHFYTRDLEEKDALVSLGWQDEGVGWTSPTTSNTPVYRLYNPNAGDHHYTTRSTERDVLVSVGWKYEGIGWYSYTEPTTLTYDTTQITGSGTKNTTIHTVDVVREYNPNAKAAGAHNYTVNRAENDFLVSIGWLDEGIAWQAMK